MARSSPTAARRTLAAVLRERREQLGLSRSAVAQHAGISVPTVHRIETAQVRAEVGTVLLMLEILEITGEDREALERMARAARTRGWWQRHADAIPHWFDQFVGLEAEASLVREYETELVPGLLQIPAYALALFDASPVPVTEQEQQHRLEVRAMRQQRLEGDAPLRLHVVLNEAVLRRQVGGVEVMREQLAHLVEIGRKRHVTIQVLPFDQGAHAGMNGAFIMMSFPDRLDRDLVYIEYRGGGLYLESDAELDTHAEMFEHLKMRALDPLATRKYISAIRSELSSSSQR